MNQKLLRLGFVVCSILLMSSLSKAQETKAEESEAKTQTKAEFKSRYELIGRIGYSIQSNDSAQWKRNNSFPSIFAIQPTVYFGQNNILFGSPTFFGAGLQIRYLSTNRGLAQTSLSTKRLFVGPWLIMFNQDLFFKSLSFYSAVGMHISVFKQSRLTTPRMSIGVSEQKDDAIISLELGPVWAISEKLKLMPIFEWAFGGGVFISESTTTVTLGVSYAL